MIVFRKQLKRLFRAGRRSLGWRKNPKKEQFIPGLPPGLSFASLNEACLLHLESPLQRAWYTPLSYWKSTCATYRLLLQPARGRLWKLIFKDAYYQGSQAALAGLPVNPGPPEYAVYTHVQGAMARYLPNVVYFQELARGEHFQYLLEDLSDAYQKDSRPAGSLRAGLILPDLHEAMRQWLELAGPQNLLHYDEAYTQGLVEYAGRTLDQYCRQVDSSIVKGFCRRWPEIAGAYPDLDLDLFQATRPIHGDFNITNILFHKKEAGLIKILDWEWAGFGLPHADLASLLNAASEDLEKAVLEQYSTRVKNGSPQEHWRSYNWCKLQRGLLDSSFTALHVLENPTPKGFDRHKFIELALQRAWQAFEVLRQ
jgi:hypothetical protein